ncbi:MAG: dynamin family protein [Pseudomonas sp.]|nr:dynamin family protein [Pseudomonas sp.]
MSMQRLHQHIDEYVTWKRELIREIMRYRSWLARNRLDTPELVTQLEQNVKMLRSDQITLAFIGEYSRGKTELINSLFFSNFGQRLLPSRAGRTTMCPTEIFFESQQAPDMLRLLPIETRNFDSSLTQLKQEPQYWFNIALDPTDANSLIKAFAHVAQNKTVSIEEAIALGFLPESLEAAEQADYVLIPAWRHALINIDHPLLHQGLRIIDTPGLNALGSEPELTLSLLPNAQAILFLLSADTGVTASDMAIWQQYVSSQPSAQQTIQFAALNKIDMLWDNLNHDTFAEHGIQTIQAQTAKQLNLPLSHVLPVSAKSALQAKVHNDHELLARSRIGALENFLCEHVIAQKEHLIERSVVQPLFTLLNASQQLISQHLQIAHLEQQQLNQQQHSNSHVLRNLLEQAKSEHQTYHRRLLNLKTNQRLLHRQGEILCAYVNPEQLQKTILKAQQQLAASWTTLGINRAITDFFTTLENDLHAFEIEAHMADKMVRAIYLRHNTDNPSLGVEAPKLHLQRYRTEQDNLHKKADQFRLNIKTLLTEQNQLSRRFFSTLVQEAITQQNHVRSATIRWANEALTPLIQHNLEQKQLLENHILRIKALTQSVHNKQQRNQLLNQFSSELHAQLAEANDILRTIRRPAPQRRQAKVVQLTPVLTAVSVKD